MVYTNQWKPVKVSTDGPTISYVLFIDDIMLFAKAFTSPADVIQRVLNNFCGSYG